MMRGASSRRLAAVFLIFLVLAASGVLVSLMMGSVAIAPQEAVAILMGADGSTHAQILWNIRLPRTLVAALVGIDLALSGAILQAIMKNPLADPHIIGISSGAGLMGILVLLLFPEHSALITPAAFVGAMLSMGFVLLISRRVRRMSLLVVCGVMIGYICSALTDFLVTFADDSNIVNLHNWSLGSFSGMSWDNVRTMAVVCGAALILTFLLSKPLRAYQLGEVYAQNLGVPLRALRAAQD